MGRNRDKTIYINRVDKQSSSDQDSEHGVTAEVSRKKYVGEIPIKQRAFLEIIGSGKKREVIELEEREIIIGRSHACGLQFSSNNVSRKHARIIFRHDEYYIEDLGSTNSTYVNGIKIVKCVLRKNDQIDIGGVKILFNE